MFRHVFHAIALFGLASIAGAASGPADAQRSPVPIVDVHAHFLPGPDLAFDEAVASAVQTMDRFGVARSIVMSPPRNRRVRLGYDYADFYAALNRYPGRFVYLAGGGTLNPLLHDHADPTTVTDAVAGDFAAAAQRAIDDSALGFGEISSLHISLAPAHGYNYVPADHPLLRVLADVAAERDVPIDLHMDAVTAAMRAPPRLAQLPNNPPLFPATLSSLERLLAHNANARIVWAHGGSDQLGELTAERVSALMDRHVNLFMSLRVVGPMAPVQNNLFSGPQVASEWLSLLIRHSDRFVIGTDSFYVGPDAARAGPIAAEFSGKNVPKLRATVRFLSLLPTEIVRKIASENAVRIYKLVELEELPALPAASGGPPSPASGGLCRDGNMEHCRIACQRGVKPACARLERSR